jgi:hypothetical protein
MDIMCNKKLVKAGYEKTAYVLIYFFICLIILSVLTYYLSE